MMLEALIANQIIPNIRSIFLTTFSVRKKYLRNKLFLIITLSFLFLNNY